MNESGAATSLRRLIHVVQSLELGEATRYEQGHLVVSESEASRPFEDAALAQVHVRCASPGDSVRIVNPLDSVQT